VAERLHRGIAGQLDLHRAAHASAGPLLVRHDFTSIVAARRDLARIPTSDKTKDDAGSRADCDQFAQ
jgi:hypothetical protein